MRYDFNLSGNIYIFSGLGADERTFDSMDLSDLNVTFIHWIDPGKDETLEEYASRLLPQISTPQPILVGLSFGGIVAQEVARQIETEKVVLIASVKNRSEIPFYYRIAGSFGLHKLIPYRFFKRPCVIMNWFFGVKGDAEKRMLQEIIRETDIDFLKWALGRVLFWKHTFIHENIIHIHGTSDRILPIRFVNCDFRIQGGGHFMTMSKAAEMTVILKKVLAMP